MERLSLCMIVRDEECDLPRCLASARDVVDELCVLDTGSRDRTVELARTAGARVETFAWADDFGKARNASLAMATGDWILVLDADETLQGAAIRERLEAFAAAHPSHAGAVTILDRQEQGDLRSRVVRFLPRREDLRYVGAFHEQPHFGDRPAPALPLDVVVAHIGYRQDAVRAKGKLERNVRFLQRRIAEEPANAYHHYQLGRTHLLVKDVPAALAAFGAAFEHVAPEAPYLPLLVELTCHCLRHMKRSREALELLDNLSSAWPVRADTRYLQGLLAIDARDLERAEACFQECLRLPSADGAGGSSAEAARTVGPAYHLALLRESRGEREQAREWYQRALAFQPTHAQSLQGLARLAS